jgi:hypothetical protein
MSQDYPTNSGRLKKELSEARFALSMLSLLGIAMMLLLHFGFWIEEIRYFRFQVRNPVGHQLFPPKPLCQFAFV